MFTYGCIAWAKATRTKEFQNKAKRLQRLAICDIGPIRTHSPTSGLEVFTNILPLDLYIKGEFIAAHNRIKTVIPTIAGTSDTLSSHYAWARKLRDEFGLHNIPTDTIVPFFHGNKKYNCINEQYNVLDEIRKNKLQIYTDGSRIKLNDLNYAGCGYVIYGPTQNSPQMPEALHERATYLGTMATVFQAEIFAIGQSAHHLITHPEMLREITAVDIITDSKAALMAVDCITTASKIVMDCMNALDKLGSLITVRLHWTKAHVGYEGNEKADQLAKEGTTKINYMAEPLLPVPKSWIRQKIQQTLLQEWTTRWLGNGEARQTKLFIPKPNAKLTKKLLTYNKETCARIFRWVSGHSFHRYHNHITNPLSFNDPTCRACKAEREETFHLFAKCTALAPIRMKICGKPTLNDNPNWAPGLLLQIIQEIEKICPEENPHMLNDAHDVMPDADPVTVTE
jgi:ribonuclease HI